MACVRMYGLEGYPHGGPVANEITAARAASRARKDPQPAPGDRPGRAVPIARPRVYEPFSAAAAAFSALARRRSATWSCGSVIVRPTRRKQTVGHFSSVARCASLRP
jgi:hypothetical protein